MSAKKPASPTKQTSLAKAQDDAVCPGVNCVQLTAVVAELKPLRYTPAGLPALDLWLEHESRVQEAGHPRQVQARIKAVALGTVAEQLKGVTLGSQMQWTGFLATPRNGKHVVLHIQEFQQD